MTVVPPLDDGRAASADVNANPAMMPPIAISTFTVATDADVHAALATIANTRAFALTPNLDVGSVTIGAAAPPF
jgi:hypothetical protein